MTARMPLVAALKVLHALRRQEILVTTMGSAREWPRLGQHPLDFHFVPSSMGQAPALGLGLALAQPQREVWVLNGDGCMLMNPGVLTTIRAAGAKNLTVFVFENGVYEVTGGQKTAGAAAEVDFPALAAAMGFSRESIETFENLDAWQQGAAAALRRPGPRFILLRVAPEVGDTHIQAPGPMAPRLAAFREALGGNEDVA